MYNKAISKYFLDVNMFNLPFCFIIGMISGIFWSIISFSTLGILFGYIGYQNFKKNQYYAYYNLGFTKAKLLKTVWLFNTIISVLLLLIYKKFR
jgi:hypothetical protein